MGTMQQAPASVADLLRGFIDIQQGRALHYSNLHQAFRIYLSNKKEPDFRQALQQATVGFSSCSQQVIKAETSLKQDHGRSDLAAMMRTVQENEREKLRLTLTLQSLKQAFAFETFSWQHEEEVDILEPRTARTCGCSRVPSVHQGDAGGHAHDEAAHRDHQHVEQAEPTQAEYEAAVREAQLLLDASVQLINEKIEEVREAMLQEEEAGDG